MFLKYRNRYEHRNRTSQSCLSHCRSGYHLITHQSFMFSFFLSSVSLFISSEDCPVNPQKEQPEICSTRDETNSNNRRHDVRNDVRISKIISDISLGLAICSIIPISPGISASSIEEAHCFFLIDNGIGRCDIRFKTCSSSQICANTF
jgi:hypothetical protein